MDDVVHSAIFRGGSGEVWRTGVEGSRREGSVCSAMLRRGGARWRSKRRMRSQGDRRLKSGEERRRRDSSPLCRRGGVLRMFCRRNV